MTALGEGPVRAASGERVQKAQRYSSEQSLDSWTTQQYLRRPGKEWYVSVEGGASTMGCGRVGSVHGCSNASEVCRSPDLAELTTEQHLSELGEEGDSSDNSCASAMACGSFGSVHGFSKASGVCRAPSAPELDYRTASLRTRGGWPCGSRGPCKRNG